MSETAEGAIWLKKLWEELQQHNDSDSSVTADTCPSIMHALDTTWY